jgi:hypothetical protein
MIAAIAGLMLHIVQAPDTAVLARIRAEGFQHSKVLETAMGLSDLNGPRLAGSSGYLRAARWARDRMAAWGLAKAALEPWGVHPAPWELDRFSVEMTAPRYLRITAFPRAWSPSTAGIVTGAPLLIRIRTDSDFAKYHGKLKGRIVMNGGLQLPRGRERPMFERYSAAALDSMAHRIDPGSPRDYFEDSGDYQDGIDARRRILAFLKSEGVMALLEPSGNDAALGAGGEDGYGTPLTRDVPSFVIGRAHWDQIVRMVQAGQPVRLTLSLRIHLVPADSIGYNVVAELPGSDPALAPEVVMLGGHLDSWASGTGATDNAAGCAIVMEALRILQAVGAHPRRTIRIGLWDGEEDGFEYMGSMGYVRHHFGEWTTMALKPEHARLSAYYNVDNGGGKLRGIYAQGDTAAVATFARFLAPLQDLGASTVAIENTGSTDHMSFVSVGLPGFQFITDALDYESRTHHSDLDIADYLVEGDLQQAAVVVATVAYQTAMADAKIPRSPLPKPRH